jgi:hypothetical protein
MANWKDVTSYSQSHPRGTVEPKSWELAGSSPRIVVTRYRGAPGWYLRTEGLDLVHLGEDLERAKAEAVRLVRERLTRMLDSLPPSDPWLPIEECGELEAGEYLVRMKHADTETLVVPVCELITIARWSGAEWQVRIVDAERYYYRADHITHVHRMGPIRGPEEG